MRFFSSILSNMKFNQTYINIVSNIAPYELDIENNKKTYHLLRDSKAELIQALRELLNTSDKHFKSILSYLENNLD